MRILFCSDALVIDGVTSYILNVGSALVKAGHEVAVLGRWAGKGFQRRYREEGMGVFTCPSPTVANLWFDLKARAFSPDVIMSDARRSFPLAVRLKRITGARSVTYFLDPLEKTDRPGRDLASLIEGSDAWVYAEETIHQSLLQAAPDFPIFFLPRPLDTGIESSKLPPRTPFHILCFGRLSRYKTPGMLHILENMGKIREKIPEATLSILGGGGWRLLKFRAMAARINRRLGAPCVRVLGTRDDPRPWLRRANVVCCGAASGVEAALSLRPVLALSGFWLGLVTPENLNAAIDGYFAERGGPVHLSQPHAMDRILPALFDVYERYDSLEPDLLTVQKRLEPLFSSRRTVEMFDTLTASLRQRGGTLRKLQ